MSAILDLGTTGGIIALFTALILGILFGFGLQRGRFCMNSAFRDLILLKDTTLLKAVLIAVVVQMVGYQLLIEGGLLDQMHPAKFVWGAQILGGFVFGIGMVLAGGCASGVSYRTGEGMVGSFIALLGLGLGALIFFQGAGADLRPFLTEHTLVAGDWTLPGRLGINPWWIIGAILVITAIIWVWRRPEVPGMGHPLKGGWPWWFTGIFLGIIGTLAFAASFAADRAYGFGITGPWAREILGTLTYRGWVMTWGGFSWIGLVIGAFLGAKSSGEFSLRIPSPGRTLQAFLGGTIMGAGAQIGFGCNIGHIFSGWPQLALSSMLGGGFIILGCWTTAYLLFMRE